MKNRPKYITLSLLLHESESSALPVPVWSTHTLTQISYLLVGTPIMQLKHGTSTHTSRCFLRRPR